MERRRDKTVPPFTPKSEVRSCHASVRQKQKGRNVGGAVLRGILAHRSRTDGSKPGGRVVIQSGIFTFHIRFVGDSWKSFRDSGFH